MKVCKRSISFVGMMLLSPQKFVPQPQCMHTHEGVIIRLCEKIRQRVALFTRAAVFTGPCTVV